jgi:hypothetical protein
MNYKIIYVLLVCSLIGYGQSNLTVPLFEKGIVKGIIIDSLDKSPLQFATITIHKEIDSSFTAGIASGVTGEFILSNLVEGSYFLKVSYVGYTNKIVPRVLISKDKKEFDVGAVQLNKVPVQMKEAQIVGEKVSEELHLDKKVINVSQNLTSSGERHWMFSKINLRLE